MPRGQGETPVISFRVPAAVVEAAQERATVEGVTLSAVVSHALRRYGEGAVNNVMPPPRSDA